MPEAPQKPAWLNHEITVPPVEHYVYSLLPARDEVLTGIENEAIKRHIPIVGPAVGRFLYQLAVASRAKTVFELGSAVGYSTIWWARAVGEGGRVIYTDGDREKADEARRYFERAGVADRITVKVGDPRAFKLAVPRVRKGGLLVADNVLWSGRVAQENPSEASTKGILEFNRLLYSSPDLFPTILPIRDGVAVAVKK
jgi:caffeoyl-CoA O-methyltransferase